MSASLLQLRNITKSFSKGQGKIAVLKGIDMDILAGETISIVGTSGAGKSTLLHIMGTLENPDEGSILFQGSKLTGQSAAQLADFRNRHLGFVFQFHQLLPEFSSLENVMIPCMIQRKTSHESARLAQQVLEEVGLAHRLHHLPSELSGGEQQRVAIARALVLQPMLLLADEVTGNLDEKTGETIHQLLFDINARRGITLVIVTHHGALADRMKRRLILDEGIVKERP